jgi:hypothetical protein
MVQHGMVPRIKYMTLYVFAIWQIFSSGAGWSFAPKDWKEEEVFRKEEEEAEAEEEAPEVLKATVGLAVGDFCAAWSGAAEDCR